jgi:flagellar assembly protein FliH
VDTSRGVIEQGDVEYYEPWVLPVIGAETKAQVVEGDSPGMESGVDEPSCEQAMPKPPTAEEIEGIRSAAEREGFESGYRDGIEKGKQSISVKVTQLSNVLDQLSEPLKTVDSEVEDALARLAFDISRQIVRRELRTAHGEVVAIVRQAVQALPLSDQQVVVSVNPEDARIVLESIEAGASKPKWTIQADPSVSRGGCRVTRGHSTIDGTVERRLAGIASSIFGDERREASGD